MKIKAIGANGQISLGKKFAGQQVLVEEQEAGVWLIRTTIAIPKKERWLHEAKAASDPALTNSPHPLNPPHKDC
jgi:hypothetical protein